MVTRWKWCTAAVLAAFLLAGAADAAAHGRESPPSPSGGQGAGSRRPVPDEEMREAMAEVMKVRLKRSLQLSPEQEERVMPRVDRLQEARHDFAARRRKALSHLRAMMVDGTAEPAQIEKALREVRSIEASFREREEALRDEINAELDPRQQARFYFFEERFRREMHRRLAERRGQDVGGRPGGGHGRGTPLPDDDAEPEPGDEEGP